MADGFDPYHKWLGIPPEEQPPNLYRLLSIKPLESDPDVIEAAADRQMTHLRTYQTGEHGPLSQKLLNEVAAARVTLLNADKKAEYDAGLREELEAETPVAETLPVAKPLPPVRRAEQPMPEIHTETAAAAAAVQPAKSKKKSLSGRTIALAAAGGVAALAILFLILTSGDESSSGPNTGATAGSSSSAKPEPVSTPDQSNLPPVPPPVADDTANSPSSEKQEPGEDNDTAGQAGSGTQNSDNTPVQPTVEPMPEKPEPVEPKPEPEPHDTAGQASSATQKPAVPSGEARKKVAGQLEEVYEISKLKKPSEKVELARRLIELGVKSKAPAEQFVLLRTAMELAGEGGDAKLMLDAVDQIAERFDVDPLKAKSKVLAGFAAEATNSARIESFIESADTVIDQAMAAEQFDMAADLADRAYRLGQRSSGRKWRKQTYTRRVEVRKLQQAWQKNQEMLAKLKEQPDDPEANLAVGRWYCFEQGDWQKGLPHLAKSSDAELKAVAKQELESPPANSAAQLKLADAWWKLSESQKGDERTALMLRAGTWYEQGQDALTGGLTQVKIKKRLAEIATLGLTIPVAGDQRPPLAVAPFAEKQAKRYQWLWAKYLDVPLETTNSIGMKLVLIPPGEFQMGSPKEVTEELVKQNIGQPSWQLDQYRSESPRHLVRITRPFYLGVHEVTQSEYERVMGTNPSKFKTVGPKGPVGQVSWNDAVAFCKKLSDLPAEKSAGRQYLLPTEAQWEYACRAGTTTAYYFGDDPALLPRYACFATEKPRPVGQLQPNAWGLHDMLGNVSEACSDWYSEAYYSESPTDDPAGPASGPFRSQRGYGCLYPGTQHMRCARRLNKLADKALKARGFRVLATVSLPEKVAKPERKTSKPKPPPPAADAKQGFPPGRWVDILGPVKPPEGVVEGQWKMTRQGLATGSSTASRISLPVVIKGDYDLKVDLTRVGGNDAIVLTFPVGSNAASVYLSPGGRSKSGLTMADGLVFPHNSAVAETGPLVQGRPYSVAISVRTKGEDAQIGATFNSRPMFRWSGKISSLGSWVMPTENQPGLGARLSTVVFHSARLRLVSGEAKLVKSVPQFRFQKEIKQPDVVNSIAVSPDGSTVAVAAGSAGVMVCDLATGRTLHTLGGGENSTFSTKFHPRDGGLVSGGNDRMVSLWNPVTGKLLRTLIKYSRVDIWSLAFNRDGSLLAIGSGGAQVDVIDFVTGKKRHSFEGHSRGLRSVAFNPTGSLLASGDSGGALKIWDLAADKLRYSLDGHTDMVRSLAFTPDGATLASGSTDASVRLWDPATGKLKRTLDTEGVRIVATAFSPDGSLLAATGAGGDNKMLIWETTNYELQQSVSAHKGFSTSLAFTPDGNTIITGASDKLIKVWTRTPKP